MALAMDLKNVCIEAAHPRRIVTRCCHLEDDLNTFRPWMRAVCDTTARRPSPINGRVARLKQPIIIQNLSDLALRNPARMGVSGRLISQIRRGNVLCWIDDRMWGVFSCQSVGAMGRSLEFAAAVL